MFILLSRKYFCVSVVMFICIFFIGIANIKAKSSKYEIANSKSFKYRPGYILVRFAPDAKENQKTKSEKNQILKNSGTGKIESDLNIVPGLHLVKLPQGLSVEDAIKKLKNRDDVLYAEPDGLVRMCTTTPDDDYYGEQWGLTKVKANLAWDTRHDGSEVIVAVIDTGVDWDHKDLEDNMWDGGTSYPNHGYDCGNDDNNPNDESGHGTMVASVIGAVGDNKTGIAGVCWEAQLMAVKITHSGANAWISNCIEGIYFAINNGAKIINASWDIGQWYNSRHPYIGLYDAIKAAEEADVLFIAAASNTSTGGTDNDSDPLEAFPAAYDLPNIISVLATDSSDDKASFSHYGNYSVDIGAPGVNIKCCDLDDAYTSVPGTSLAAPFVSGAAALIWSQNTSLKYYQVKQLILQYADHPSSLSSLCVTSGRLNIDNALDHVGSVATNLRDDINPWYFSWDNVYDIKTFYGMDSSGNGKWIHKKCRIATENLNNFHCRTDDGHNISHYHFDSDFDLTQRDYADNYWDWFFPYPIEKVDSASTNIQDSLAYTMSGYSGNATYNYWIIHSEESDQIFTDDCTARAPSSAVVNDCIAYEDEDDIYQHVSVVEELLCGTVPSKLTWICEYSPIYEFYTDYGSDNRFSTPGRDILDPIQLRGSGGPEGADTVNPDRWDGDNATVFYPN